MGSQWGGDGKAIEGPWRATEWQPDGNGQWDDSGIGRGGWSRELEVKASCKRHTMTKCFGRGGKEERLRRRSSRPSVRRACAVASAATRTLHRAADARARGEAASCDAHVLAQRGGRNVRMWHISASIGRESRHQWNLNRVVNAKCASQPQGNADSLGLVNAVNEREALQSSASYKQAGTQAYPKGRPRPSRSHCVCPVGRRVGGGAPRSAECGALGPRPGPPASLPRWESCGLPAVDAAAPSGLLRAWRETPDAAPVSAP